MVSKSRLNLAIGYPWASFLRFCEVLKDVFFDKFLVRQKVGPKSNISAILVPKTYLDKFFGGVGGRGDVPGKRKSWGFED